MKKQDNQRLTQLCPSNWASLAGRRCSYTETLIW